VACLAYRHATRRFHQPSALRAASGDFPISIAGTHPATFPRLSTLLLLDLAKYRPGGKYLAPTVRFVWKGSGLDTFRTDARTSICVFYCFQPIRLPEWRKPTTTFRSGMFDQPFDQTKSTTPFFAAFACDYSRSFGLCHQIPSQPHPLYTDA